MQLRPHQLRAIEAMQRYTKGQVIVPTGGGKTLKAIYDAIQQFLSETAQTIVVVAPRILLAEQLCSEFLEFITNANVMHIHTGETHHFRTTKPDVIHNWCKHIDGHKLIFTTYHSLHRLVEANVEVNTIYFDEAHNSVRKDFFPSVEHFSQEADRCYFFTATPKHSATISKPGMNDVDVYGNVICKVSAPELINGGFILPPKVVVREMPETVHGDIAERDCNNLYATILEQKISKVLICASATKHIVGLVSRSNFVQQMSDLGYSVMYITAKTGAVIDGERVNREVFFQTLSKWGKDDSKKFVVLHHSILSEGINVSGLEGVIFMRNMDYINFSQTIGRVIRLHHKDAKDLQDGTITPGDVQSYHKSFGLLVVPVFSKVGIHTAQKLQAVVDTIFEKGEPAISVVKK